MKAPIKFKKSLVPKVGDKVIITKISDKEVFELVTITQVGSFYPDSDFYFEPKISVGICEVNYFDADDDECRIIKIKK